MVAAGLDPDPRANEQEIILEAIHGALNQDYPDFEVIVIDDGSTDMTAHLAGTTSARLIRHDQNRGKAAALNSGRSAARGEVIVTCDADGYLDPQALRHLVAPLADPSVGVVAGQVRLFHPRGPSAGSRCWSTTTARGCSSMPSSPRPAACSSPPAGERLPRRRAARRRRGAG